MKKITALLTALALVLGLCACSRTAAATWQEQYDLGVRYLSEGNYREAIIAFNAAIEIDPKRADAYAARGDAYLGSALFEEAIADYQGAIRREKGISIAVVDRFLAGDYQAAIWQGNKAEYYLRLSDGYLAQGDLDAAIDALRDGYNVTHEPALQERITAIRHISVFQGGVFTWGDNYLNTPIPDAVVTVRDAATGAVVLSYKTDAEGLYHGYAVEGEYEFFAHSEGYQPALIYKSIGADETVYVENLYLLPGEEGSTGTVRGTVYSAVTGEPIAGAEVWIAANWNQQDSNAGEVSRTISDLEGRYVISEQEVGYYTVFASYEGYVTSSVNIVVSSSYEGNWDIMLSPRLSADEELRIVLTWGSKPEDLDSHLIMDCNNWEDGFFNYENDTFYQTMAAYDETYNLIAQLDVDDTTSYGPETITVYELRGHSFTYVVHDYTNWGVTGSTALSESEARVIVYGTDGILGIFYVPVNMQGDAWVVFSIDESGSLHSVGEMTNT